MNVKLQCRQALDCASPLALSSQSAKAAEDCRTPKLRIYSVLLTLLALAFAPHLHAALTAAEPDIRRDATVEAVEMVMPSVVNIATRTVVPVRDPFEDFYRRFYGQPRSDTLISLGSGVIIDEDGYLLTNDHVVRRADEIAVKLNTGTNVYEAVVIASDPKRDVALLKLKSRPGEKFQAIKLAREDDLLLGETVLALGNPSGLGGSVTRGILSSKSRTMPKEGAPLDIPNWLQTDAPINQGNSGGPLVNLRGELIGLNVAVLYRTPSGEPVQGIGFAIPIRLVEEALADILPTEFVKGYWFGARVKIGSLPLVVSSVQPGSPAAEAGLRPGDAVLNVNGSEPRSFIDFSDLLGRSARGEIRLAVQRGGAQRTINVRLVPEATVFNADYVRGRLGLNLEELTAEVSRRYRINPGEAFLITGVEDQSPAAEAGLQNGMLITAIDGQMPESLTELAKLIAARKTTEPLVVEIAMLRRWGRFLILSPAVVRLKPR